MFVDFDPTSQSMLAEWRFWGLVD